MTATKDIEIVFHNVAQVPVAKDKDLFWSVNRDGTQVILDCSIENKVSHMVYTSSSAVFGIPKTNPVGKNTIPRPMESYGEAKLAGEKLCHDYMDKGLIVSILRPRTILGHGRLGIFQILFEWVRQGKNVPVLGSGDNSYQFIHAEDLARATILASEKDNSGIYNIGTPKFGSMREALENLISAVSSKSRVCSVSSELAETGMNLTSALGLSPLGPYHALMYGRSMYFDTLDAKRDLGFEARYSNDEMFLSAYRWYEKNFNEITKGNRSGSVHQKPVNQGILKFVPYFLS